MNFEIDMDEMDLINPNLIFENDGIDEVLSQIDTSIFEDAALPNQSSNASENEQNPELYEPPQKKQDKREELLEYVQSNRNKNTTIKTTRETGRFLDYLEKEGETRNLRFIPPEDMDTYLGSFLKNLVKKNGEEYEPDSVSSFFR